MKTIYINYPLRLEQSYEPSYVAIGNFDGIHKGHQQVIKKVVEEAKQHKIKSSVMTFTPHPKEVLGKVTHLAYLTTLEEKLSLIKNMGVDICFVVNFNPAFANISKEDFIYHFLLPLNIKAVTVGFDFRFGRFGQGEPSDFVTAGVFFSVNVIEAFNIADQKISSTNIREEINNGELEKVTQMLDRNYTIMCEPISVIERNRFADISNYSIYCKKNKKIATPKEGMYFSKVRNKNNVFWGFTTFSKKGNQDDVQIIVEIVGNELIYSELQVTLVKKMNDSVVTLKEMFLDQIFEEELTLGLRW